MDPLPVADGEIPVRRVETAATARLRTARWAKRQDRFIKGPLPFAWIAAAQASHPKGLAVALAVEMAVDRASGRAVPLPTGLLAELGVGRETRRRALAALEQVGLVQVERVPGRLPRVRLAAAADRADERQQRPCGRLCG